jgi:hypothetical protein
VGDSHSRTDSGEVVKRTQAQRDAIIRARELAMENATVNVVI